MFYVFKMVRVPLQAYQAYMQLGYQQWLVLTLLILDFIIIIIF